MSNDIISAPDRDFEFTGRDFERVRTLIYGHAGISLSAVKRDLVYSRLSRRLRAVGMSSFEKYLDRLEADADADSSEWQAFVNALTTNLTSFFRESHHCPLLAEHMKSVSRRPVTLWCSAASTGEEPYSMAITAVEAFGTFDPPVRILATDIDTNVLETAERGVYGLDRIEQLSPERRKKFFQRGTGANAGKVRVREELRRMVVFRQVNLQDPKWPVGGPLDVIFCRNVMIYFDKPTQLKILERFAPLLADDGLLFAGHSESFQNAAHIFHSRGKTVYEKVSSMSALRKERAA